MPGIIEADDLTKTFNEIVAVSHIRFSVKKGEIFGFLGPNGAGKTTTMRMIECVSPRTSGTLRVFGMDPDINPAGIKQRIGVVPQETNLDPDFTCAGNLLTYARYFDIPTAEAERRVENLLVFVALTEKRNTAIDKLSGGMKRRLILARALINNPDLLILDEPTIGLDPQARHLIWDRLRLLRRREIPLSLPRIISTRLLGSATGSVIMDHGTFLVEGNPADLVRDHVGNEIIEMDNTPEVTACLAELGVPYESLGNQVQVATDASRELAKTLLDRCKTSRVSTRPATLEDVFLKLTGRTLRE